MDFNEIKQKVNEANLAVERCEKEKGKIPGKLEEVQSLLTSARDSLNTAGSKNPYSEGDSETVREAKAEQLFKALVKAKESQIKFSKIWLEIDDFVKKTLVHDISISVQKVFIYRKFRRKLEDSMVHTKLEIALGVSQFKKYLSKQKADKNLIKHVDDFLAALKNITLHQITKKDAEQIKKLFKKMMPGCRMLFFHSKNHDVSKGIQEKYIGSLNTLLDEAIVYTNNAEKVWTECQKVIEKLGENKYVKAVREELGVRNANKKIKVLKKTIARKEQKLKDMIVQLSPERAEEMLEELEAVRVPEAINWLQQTYNLAEWGYKEFGEDVGEKIGLPQKADFEFEIETPELSSNVSIPIFEAVFASLTFDFGASLSASAKFGGELTLNNFLSATEPNYVSGEITASAELKASAYVGVGLQILKLIHGSARAALSGEASIEAKAPVALKKANADQIAVFTVSASNEIKMLLQGKLEAVIGLTTGLKIIIKAITGRKPELRFSTPTYDFFKATRADSMEFEMPFRNKPVTFPNDMLNVKRGNWEVDFIAKEQIKATFEAYFGSVKKLEEKMKESPLDVEEIDALREQYGVFNPQERA